MDVAQIVVRVLVAAVAAIIFVAVLAAVSRRVLGVPVGRVRAALAAVVAVVAEVGFESQVVWGRSGGTAALIPVQIGLLFLVALVFLVLAELVLPTGSVPRPDRWVRAARDAWARTRRYSQITRIAARHDLMSLRRRPRPGADRQAQDAVTARELRQALQEAGVTFVKFGQVLSTRPDLLPQVYIDELSRLQEQVAPLPWAQVAEVLTEELGRPPSQVFAEVDHEPLAAASIGQVHRARLLDGSDVVVKVQRPGIRPIIERDLDIAFRIARILQTTTDWGRSLCTVTLVDGFATAIREELDFRVELRNVIAIAAATAGHPDVPHLVIPKVRTELSTERVLVMEYLSGITLSSFSRGTAPSGSWPAARRDADAHTLFDSLLRQVLLDGLFHADPHPGNIMLLRSGELALLDFGSVGRIGPDLRSGLQHTLLAVRKADPQALTDAVLALLGRPENFDERQLQQDLGRFLAVHLAPGSVPDMAMFTSLLRILTEHRFSVPVEMAAAFRAFATIDGTLRTLAPSFDMVSQARDFAAAQVRAMLEPATLSKTVTDELLTALPHLRRLPRQIDQLADALGEGRVTVRLRTLADPEDRRVITGIVHLVILAFLGGTTGLMATMLLISTGGPPIGSGLSLYQLFGYLLAIVSVVLVLRVVLEIFRRHPD